MLVFRSEDHLARWLEAGHPRGETLSLETQWSLAVRWFRGRDRPEWQRRSAEQAESVFRELGLDSHFWSFEGSA